MEINHFFFSYMPGFSLAHFETVQTLYQKNAFMAVFSAAFTPIPYKVFTIAAGVFEISLLSLVIASTLGRAGRFFLVSILIRIFDSLTDSKIFSHLSVSTFLINYKTNYYFSSFLSQT